MAIRQSALEELVDAMSDAQTVQCNRHGNTRAAYVCSHLLQGSNHGFFASEDDPDDPYPDAWCAACEKIRETHAGSDGAWNEQSEALIEVKLVCGECYQEIKARNIEFRRA
jgi:hypothetical protein